MGRIAIHPRDPASEYAQRSHQLYPAASLLAGTLPLLAEDSAETREQREAMAMAGVAGLRPRDGTEAMLAVEVVGLHSAALECLRLATTAESQVAAPAATPSASQPAAKAAEVARDRRNITTEQPHATFGTPHPEAALQGGTRVGHRTGGATAALAAHAA